MTVRLNRSGTFKNVSNVISEYDGTSWNDRQIYRKENGQWISEYNLLENGSFELDATGTYSPTGWTYPKGENNSEGWYVTTDYSAPNRSGTQTFGATWDENPGSWTQAYVYQDVTIGAGENLQGSFIVRLQSFDNANWTGTDPDLQYVWEDDARLHLYYYDSTDTLISEEKTRWGGDAYNRGLDYITQLGTSNWFAYNYSFTTPSNTAYVRFQIDGSDANDDYVDPDADHGGNAAMWIDHCRLNRIR